MVPQLFTVELHVISDKEHQVNFKRNDDLIAYMAVMSNAVNLRYVDMQNPRIKFKLMGITRNKNDSFSKVGRGTVESDPTLQGLAKYFQRGQLPGNPDLVYFVTGLDMIEFENGEMKRGIRVCTP
ncbi:uncharacterized protein LOC119444333 [Dermacentor silvarum]|uniref:uncharacterized protein LOC119444333 n=1 Tax=Dermacentor silvarum TaxID=543639 RepID=UPI00189807FA|nr:uncharacterized protein LOC119444333 [Dermacentor silvarum]